MVPKEYLEKEKELLLSSCLNPKLQGIFQTASKLVINIFSRSVWCFYDKPGMTTLCSVAGNSPLLYISKRSPTLISTVPVRGVALIKDLFKNGRYKKF